MIAKTLTAHLRYSHSGDAIIPEIKSDTAKLRMKKLLFFCISLYIVIAKMVSILPNVLHKPNMTMRTATPTLRVNRNYQIVMITYAQLLYSKQVYMCSTVNVDYDSRHMYRREWNIPYKIAKYGQTILNISRFY